MRSEMINENYMKWLEYFILINGNFDTKTINYEKTLSNDDKFNLNNFGNLYEKIRNYAHQNNIEEKSNDKYSYYSIKYNEKGYYIFKSNNEDGLFVIFKNNDLDNIQIDVNDILGSDEKVKKLI